MTSGERFDVFDENMVKIGEETRENVHAKGLWHQTFHCWVISRSPNGDQLILQLRHKDKDTYPDMLDVSCAGHLLSGERPEDGVRELEEELGIAVDISELIYCGTTPQAYKISERLIDREFNHVYLYESSRTIEEYRFQTEEIAGLFYVSVQDFRQLVSGAARSAWLEGVVLDENTGETVHSRRELLLADLTPNSADYYSLLFNKVEQLTM